MAASVNRVTLIGCLGKDPETRYTQAGTAVTSFSLATSERFKAKNGEWEERTEWHNVTAWGKLAEICGEYLTKGKLVYIEGRLQTRKWEDRDGKDRYTTEVVADKMVMLGGKGEKKENKPGASAPATKEEPQFDPNDDIPF